MPFCENCGTQVEAGDMFCPNCGSRIFPETPAVQEEMNTQPISVEEISSAGNNEQTSPSFNDVMNKVSSGASEAAKAVSAGANEAMKMVSSGVNQVSKKMEEVKIREQEKVKAQVEAEADRQRKLKEQKRKNAMSQESVRYMSKTELWSWLKQNSKRQVFYTPADKNPNTEMTEEEFIALLNEKLEANHVNAEIEARKIEWDRSAIYETTYAVKPITNVVNPLTYLVQFNHVGDFTFVEEKTFITPPDLPESPLRPVRLPHGGKGANTLAYGIVGLVLGCIFLSMRSFREAGVGLIVCGLILLFVWWYEKSQDDAARAHNAKCAEMERKWNAAWANWRTSIFAYSFQEDINGQLSRIYDAVFECIKQISAENFEDCKVQETDESANINELEQLIERRKQEYR